MKTSFYFEMWHIYFIIQFQAIGWYSIVEFQKISSW